MWNASLSAKRQAESERQDAIAQAATTAVANKATNLGYKGDLTNTAAMQNFIYDSNKAETDRQTALANQQAVEKAVADRQVTVQPQPAAANQTTVAPNSTSVVPSVSAGTNFTGVSNNLGPLNISNLGAVISPQAMNSTAGGVASLVGPQVTVQPAVTQQPAVNYTYAPSSQQQLEDQAVNAGYQGDYSDTAAMQGYLNSNAGGVASLVSPQVTVQPQPTAGTGTVLAPSPSQTQQTIQPSAVVQQPAPISATARNNALLANIAAAMKKK